MFFLRSEIPVKPFHTTIAFILPVSALALLTGCGSSLQQPTSASDSSPNITGSWLFSGSSVTPSIAAGIIESDDTIAGTASISGCSSMPEQTTLTGSVDDQGTFNIKTGELPGGTALLLTGKLNSDGKTISNASLVASGSACASGGATQTISGQLYAPASGNYSGTFTGSDGDATQVAATLLQSTNPGPGGSYTLSGSVSFPSSPCLATASIESASSTVTAGKLSAVYGTTVDGVTVTIQATGTADATASHIVITNWTISGGTCDGYSGTGALSD